MALSFPSDTADSSPLSQINTTPLVDVMLVLLIIFLITIPVVTTSIKVALPKESTSIRETKPNNVVLTVDAKGQLYWFDAPIPNAAELAKKLKAASLEKPQPELQLRGDGQADFEKVGQVISSAQRAGIQKIGFITEPTAP